MTIPEEYKSTSAYKRSFAVLTLVWGVVNLMRAGGRGWMITHGSLEQLMVVNLATGWPVFAALVAFSVWYPRRLAQGFVESIGGDPGWPTGSSSARSKRPTTSSSWRGPRSRTQPNADAQREGAPRE